MMNKVSFGLKKNLFSQAKCNLRLVNYIIASLACMQFSTKRTHGGLKDQDRIFTNLYKDEDPFIEGALKRVSLIPSSNIQ